MISTGVMKNEGTSQFDVPDAFPAVPDLKLTWMMIQTAREKTEGSDRGGMWALRLLMMLFEKRWNSLRSCDPNKAMYLDMESSALYCVTHMRGVRAATINGTSGNLTNAQPIYTKKE